MTRPQAALAAIGLAVAAGLVALAVYTWQSLGAVAIDSNGYIALALGVLGTAALGGGLMALLFYSHRQGFDDQAGGRSDRRGGSGRG